MVKLKTVVLQACFKILLQEMTWNAGANPQQLRALLCIPGAEKLRFSAPKGNEVSEKSSFRFLFLKEKERPSGEDGVNGI